MELEFRHRQIPELVVLSSLCYMLLVELSLSILRSVIV